MAIMEELSWTLFDRTALATTGTLLTSAKITELFQTAEGGATDGFTTNMPSAGVLPVNHSMKIKAISLVFGYNTVSSNAMVASASIQTDLAIVINAMKVKFLVNDQVKWYSMVFNVPAGAGLSGLATTGNTSGFYAPQNGGTDPTSLYKIVPIEIKHQTPFKLQVYQGTNATAASVYWAVLHGEYTRPALSA